MCSQLSSHSPPLHRGFFGWVMAFTHPGRKRSKGQILGRQREGRKILQAMVKNNVHPVPKHSLQWVLLPLRLIKCAERPLDLGVSSRYGVGMQSWPGPQGQSERRKGICYGTCSTKYGLVSCVWDWRGRIKQCPAA